MWWAELLNNILAVLGDGGGATNSYESIATVTVGAGGASSVSFSSISGSYKHLQLRALAQTNRATYGRDTVKLQINGDTGSNYAWHEVFGDGGGAYANAFASQTKGEVGEVGTTTGGAYGAFVTDFLDYTNVNKYKTVRSLFGGDHNGTIAGYGGTTGLYSTLWLSTSAITSLTLTPNAGTLFSQYSSFALYGVK